MYAVVETHTYTHTNRNEVKIECRSSCNVYILQKLFERRAREKKIVPQINSHFSHSFANQLNAI